MFSKTVHIETHGCKLNHADSQRLVAAFVQAGYALVEDAAQADVCVVNTCTVTQEADSKARQALRGARRRNPHALVVAAGCYPQRAPQEVAHMPFVDMAVGNVQKDQLVVWVTQAMEQSAGPPYQETERTAGRPATVRARAMVKIQEGCDQVCAYCIVPRVRGRERSIPADVLVGQVQSLVSEGYREVVLTGTQLGSYGFDLQGTSLPRLLGRLLEETTVERLRVSSLQSLEVTVELLALWRDPRLCPHFHLPLQSGSGRVLRAMRRRYTPEQFEATVEAVRASTWDAAITTDVIAGFPGETEADFQDTLALCGRVGFADMHVFPYSARPGTSAAYLSQQAPAATKRRRVQALLALGLEHRRRFRERALGTVRPVLWETSVNEEGAQVWHGLTDTYIRVAAPSPAPLRNRTTLCRLERVEGEMVYSQVVDGA